jgi:hypothetical protein
MCAKWSLNVWWPANNHACRYIKHIFPAKHSPKPPSKQDCFLSNISLFTNLVSIPRHAVAQLVEGLRYKPEGRGFGSRWGLWDFSLP